MHDLALRAPDCFRPRTAPNWQQAVWSQAEMLEGDNALASSRTASILIVTVMRCGDTGSLVGEGACHRYAKIKGPVPFRNWPFERTVTFASLVV